MGKRLTSIAGLAVIAVIVLAANLIGALILRPVKIDLTADKLYTLSPGSVNIARKLADPVTAQFYYSRTALADVPMLKTYADRIQGLLREYQSVAGGKIKLEVIDPRPDTQEEESAERYGLTPFSLPMTQEMIYLGLVLRDESDHQQVIPVFSPDKEETLEYDITKALSALGPKAARKKIGVISSLNIMGGPRMNPMNPMMQQQQDQPWYVIQELKNNFDVQSIETEAKEIPDGLDALLIIHPKNLSDDLQYAIDQYLLKGGKILAFVDPNSEADQAAMGGQMNMQMAMSSDYSSNLPKLFKAWGVEMIGAGAEDNKDKPGDSGPRVIGDPTLAVQVPSQRGGAPKDMIVWMRLGEENRNAQEIITAGLENIIMATPGGLRKTSVDSKLEFTPLLHTSPKASTVDPMAIKFFAMAPDPDSLLRDFKPGSAEITLAAKITGDFKTAFPEGDPARKDAATTAAAGLKSSEKPGAVIVVADTDMISDRFSVNVQNFLGYRIASLIDDNIPFAINAVDNFAGSQDLIALRSRGRSQRPLTAVRKLQQKAQDEWKAQEDALNRKIQEANDRLSKLQRGDSEKRILDQALMKEVSALREERAAAREELRNVKRKLREGVERLSFVVKAVNIALIPFLIAVISIAIAIFRTNRRRVAS